MTLVERLEAEAKRQDRKVQKALAYGNYAQEAADLRELLEEAAQALRAHERFYDVKTTPDDMTTTYVSIQGKGEYPFTETGYVYHKKDLSDLASPYLEAVKEARKARG